MDTGRLNYSRIAKLAMTPICQYLAEIPTSVEEQTASF